jgi:hypothetical protein
MDNLKRTLPEKRRVDFNEAPDVTKVKIECAKV